MATQSLFRILSKRVSNASLSSVIRRNYQLDPSERFDISKFKVIIAVDGSVSSTTVPDRAEEKRFIHGGTGVYIWDRETDSMIAYNYQGYPNLAQTGDESTLMEAMAVRDGLVFATRVLDKEKRKNLKIALVSDNQSIICAMMKKSGTNSKCDILYSQIKKLMKLEFKSNFQLRWVRREYQEPVDHLAKAGRFTVDNPLMVKRMVDRFLALLPEMPLMITKMIAPKPRK